MIGDIGPAEILAALPPPTARGLEFQPLGGNLSFYRLQSGWIDQTDITVLHFADYDAGLRQLVDQFGGNGAFIDIPRLNEAASPLPELSIESVELARAYYERDLAL